MSNCVAFSGCRAEALECRPRGCAAHTGLVALRHVGSYSSLERIEPTLPLLEGRLLTTGPPGKSLGHIFLKKNKNTQTLLKFLKVLISSHEKVDFDHFYQHCHCFYEEAYFWKSLLCCPGSASFPPVCVQKIVLEHSRAHSFILSIAALTERWKS